jgi:hypothetical protein
MNQNTVDNLTEAAAGGTKIVNTIMGALGLPARARRKEAEAEVYAIEIVGAAEIEQLEKKELLRERFYQKEMWRLANLEKIAKSASAYLTKIQDKIEVHPDWTIRFIEAAQDTSDESLQSIWAKLLASEVAQPESISFRTLELVKSLTPKEARTFSDFCSSVVLIESKAHSPCYMVDTVGSFRNRLTCGPLAPEISSILDSTGLFSLSSVYGSALSFRYDEQVEIKYGNKKLNIVYKGSENREGINKTMINCWVLTPSGTEIYRACGFTFNQAFWDRFKLGLKDIGFEIKEATI